MKTPSIVSNDSSPLTECNLPKVGDTTPLEDLPIPEVGSVINLMSRPGTSSVDVAQHPRGLSRKDSLTPSGSQRGLNRRFRRWSCDPPRKVSKIHQQLLSNESTNSNPRSGNDNADKADVRSRPCRSRSLSLSREAHNGRTAKLIGIIKSPERRSGNQVEENICRKHQKTTSRSFESLRPWAQNCSYVEIVNV